MDPNAAVLTTSIVAVVLGGIGLIGGIIGYVQGTAALHRAGSARQRAAAAEEAALQARAAAEAATRSAEQLLARLQPLDASNPRTGPLPTGPVPSPVRPISSTPSPPQSPSPAARDRTASPTAQPASGGDLLSSRPRSPERAAPVVEPVARAAQPAPRVLPPVPRADPIEVGRPAEGQPAEAFTIPLSTSSPAPEPEPGPGRVETLTSTPDASPFKPPEPEPERAQPVPLPAPDPQPEAHLEPDAEDDREEGRGEDGAAAVPQPVAAQSSEPGPEPAQPSPGAEPAADDEQPDSEQSTEPDAASQPDDEAAAPERGSRGQVVVGARDAPPMDWAEVLRTGAIPLPSISRGTYAAPRSAPGPAGDGPARFELRMAGRQRYEAVNIGGQQADEARVEGAGDDPHLVRPLTSRPAAVPPGGTLAFSVLRVEGRGASVQVVWERDGETVRQDLQLD